LLDQRIADEKDPGAFAQIRYGLRVRFCQGSEATIKTLKSSNRSGTISLRCASGFYNIPR
jgi:hypothetical protein